MSTTLLQKEKERLVEKASDILINCGLKKAKDVFAAQDAKGGMSYCVQGAIFKHFGASDKELLNLHFEDGGRRKYQRYLEDMGLRWSYREAENNALFQVVKLNNTTDMSLEELGYWLKDKGL